MKACDICLNKYISVQRDVIVLVIGAALTVHMEGCVCAHLWLSSSFSAQIPVCVPALGGKRWEKHRQTDTCVYGANICTGFEIQSQGNKSRTFDPLSLGAAHSRECSKHLCPLASR